jgi:hypothetical protein
VCFFSIEHFPKTRKKKIRGKKRKNENEKKEKNSIYQTELVRGKQSQTHRSEKKREKLEKLLN